MRIPWLAILSDQKGIPVSDNFGKVGDLNKYRGSAKPTGLPQWLLDQMSANTRVDEGGGQSTEYSFNDNPYGGFKGQDGKYHVQVGQNKLKDPSRVTVDPDLGEITDPDNVIDIKPEGINYAMLAAALTAGAGGAALGLGEAGGLGAAAAGAGELAPLTGVTLAPETAIGALGEYGGAGALGGGAAAAGGAAGAGGLAPLTGVTLAPETAIGTMGTYGGAGGGLAGLGASGGASGSTGAGLSPLTGVQLEPETAIGTMGEYTGGGSPSLLQQAGSAITNNPGQAARLGLGLAAMGGAARSSNTSGGAGTDANSIIEQMANANRVNWNTPLGSRAWDKKPDGTWAVNDTLNPAEQANFENVQGMNSGVTDYAKQALARLLSAAPAQRADRSFTVNGHTIGG
jgi:hypothetical protein